MAYYGEEIVEQVREASDIVEVVQEFLPLKRKGRLLILHHLRANQYDGSWTDSAVRRFDREMAEHLDDLLQLSRADITSARKRKRETAIGQLDHLWQRIQALREIDSRQAPLPSGLGNHIMQRFDLQPGRAIGDMKRALEQAVAGGRLEPQQDSEYYVECLHDLGT